MQNARLSELERLLAKTSAKPSPVKMSTAVKSSEEFNSLKEENRVVSFLLLRFPRYFDLLDLCCSSPCPSFLSRLQLMEAMDVLQEQVANYENEIRMLNTTKTPKRVGSKGIEPKGSASASKRQQSQRNLMASQRNLMDDMQGNTSSAAVGALEAALFRPALHGARCDAAKWKNKSMSAALLSLPPLAVPGLSESSKSNEESKEEPPVTDDTYDSLSRLTSALSNYRMEQASTTVVDLEKAKGRSRAHLRTRKAQKIAAEENLEAAAAAVKSCLARYGDAPGAYSTSANKHLLGKVKLHGKEPFQSISTNVNKDELYRLFFHLD